MPLLITLASIFAALFAVLIVRAISFQPCKKKQTARVEKLTVDTDRAVAELSRLIECKTVSSRNKTEEDEREFEKFERTLPEVFSVIYKKCVFGTKTHCFTYIYMVSHKKKLLVINKKNRCFLHLF